MIKNFARVVAVLTAAATISGASLVTAQQQPRRLPAPRAEDPVPQSHDSVRARELRIQIEEAFTRRLQTELGLSEEQATRARVIMERNAQASRSIGPSPACP